jgi:transposase
MMGAVLRRAQHMGLLPGVSHGVAIDSTGLESGHVSTYFARRTGRIRHEFPKIAQVVDTRSHLTLASLASRGPSPDDPQLRPLTRQAHARQPFTTLLADAGYDAEHHHRFLHMELGVRGIIPPRRGRPIHQPGRLPSGPYRRRLHQRFPRKRYGQRWQVETRFSMEKRLLDSHLRSRSHDAQARESERRVLTLNLMILAESHRDG